MPMAGEFSRRGRARGWALAARAHPHGAGRAYHSGGGLFGTTVAPHARRTRSTRSCTCSTVQSSRTRRRSIRSNSGRSCSRSRIPSRRIVRSPYRRPCSTRDATRARAARAVGSSGSLGSGSRPMASQRRISPNVGRLGRSAECPSDAIHEPGRLSLRVLRIRRTSGGPKRAIACCTALASHMNCRPVVPVLPSISGVGGG